MSHPHEQRVGTESQQSGEIKVVTIFQWRMVSPDIKDNAILTLVLKDANAGFCEFKSM